MSDFKVDILTPAKIVAKDLPASDILVNTTRGEINLLKDHTHLITKLETGLLKIADKSNQKSVYTISNGICKILNDKVMILTNSSKKGSEVDTKEVETELVKLQRQLSNGSVTSDVELDNLLEKIRLNQSYLAASKLDR